MSYEKQTWQTGDTITSEKLNHLEDGVSEAFIAPPIQETDVGKVLGVTQDAEENPVYGLVPASCGVLVVTAGDITQGHGLNKTYAQIKSAYDAGQVVIVTETLKHAGVTHNFCGWLMDALYDGGYQVLVGGVNVSGEFIISCYTADAEDDYPYER